MRASIRAEERTDWNNPASSVVYPHLFAKALGPNVVAVDITGLGHLGAEHTLTIEGADEDVECLLLDALAVVRNNRRLDRAARIRRAKNKENRNG